MSDSTLLAYAASAVLAAVYVLAAIGAAAVILEALYRLVRWLS